MTKDSEWILGKIQQWRHLVRKLITDEFKQQTNLAFCSDQGVGLDDVNCTFQKFLIIKSCLMFERLL